MCPALPRELKKKIFSRVFWRYIYAGYVYTLNIYISSGYPVNVNAIFSLILLQHNKLIGTMSLERDGLIRDAIE